MKTAKALGIATLVSAAAACGGSNPESRVAQSEHSPIPSPTASCKDKSIAVPIGHTGASSTVALARASGRRVAYVADEDKKAILTVDLDSREEIASTTLGATPGQVYVAKDGRVFVTLRDRAQIAVFAAKGAEVPLSFSCRSATAVEPIAIASSPDESTIVVSAGWGRALDAFDASTLARKFETPLPREPRAVIVSDDGKTAFVSHAVGAVMSVVDLAGREHAASTLSMRGAFLETVAVEKSQRRALESMEKSNPAQAQRFREELDKNAAKERERQESCQGFSLAKTSAVPGRIFAPQVTVDPGDLEQRTDGYGDANQETESPSVAVVDEDARKPFAASLTLNRGARMWQRARDPKDTTPPCLLPRAAAVDPSTKSLLVTCYGIDAVVAYDATSPTPLNAERKRWIVGSGPSGIAVDTEKHRAVVWAQFDRTLTTFPIGGTELVDDTTVPTALQRTAMPALRDKLPAEYALGRILFHAAGDARIAGDGRACASCHPDGRDDAITWATPEGPRRSIMLAGRATAASAPFSWNGNESSIPNHLGNTFDRLGGKGLRSIELDALVAYIAAMPPPPPLAPQDKAKVERGHAIFTSREAGCSGCHAGSAFTDGKNHDVGSKHKADRASAFNTPSLHLVGGTGPYFHDGRYTTLGELLEKSDGKMGKTKHLSATDRESLETYLRTL